MKFESWGELPYTQATEKQLALVEQRIANKIEDTWVFCAHPKLVTLGRGSSVSDLKGWSGEVHKSSRGGKATFHGPNQVIIYPIVQLKQKDILKFLENLEEVTVNTLKKIGIDAQKSRQAFPGYSGNKLIPTGVWVGQKKIASIGIAVKKWTTYHGIAINIYEDSEAFTGINPCGFSSDVMTSIEKELESIVEKEYFIEAFQNELIKFFN